MDIQQLRYFLAAARCENVTKAAEELYMSQPNLSTALRRLEDNLGIPLFNRRRGRISLTPSGRVYLESVTRALEILDGGEKAARGIYEADRRRIRVAAPLQDLTADVLADFPVKYPGASIRQFNFTNVECLQALEKNTVDIAIVFGPVHREGITFVPLSGCERVILAGPSHRFYGRDYVNLKELDGENCICNISRDDGRFLQLMREHYGVNMQVVCECDNDLVEKNLLSTGIGVSISPLMNYRKLIHRDVDFPARMVRIREQTEPVELGYAVRDGYDMPEEVLEMCRALREIFAGETAAASEFLTAEGYEI